MLSEFDLGWASAFLDSEGCITLVHYKPLDRYQLEVSITNSNLEMLTKFRNLFGVGIVRPRRQFTNKPLWLFQARSREAEAILRVLAPHLIEKREQAKVGLESRQYVVRRTKPGGGRLRPDTTRLAKLKAHLSALKKPLSNLGT